MVFEDMGLKYIGPIDGHDINMMSRVFNKVKEINEPVVIHVITQKERDMNYRKKPKEISWS